MKLTSILAATLVALTALISAPTPVAAQTTTTTTSTPVAAQTTTTPTINSEHVARVWLGAEIARFEGNFGDILKSTIQNQTSVWEYGSFTWFPTVGITALSLNGVDEPIDPNKPLLGLPSAKSGIRTQFYAGVSAYDQYDTYIGHGFFETLVLKQSDPISLLMRPADVQSIVQFTLPAGVNGNNLVIQLTDGSTWTYNPRYDGFSIWHSPVTGTGYRIFDQVTGIVYSMWHITPFEGMGAQSTDSLLSIQYEAGVVDVPFTATSGYIYRQMQQLDGHLEDGEGNLIAGKTYMIKTLKGRALNAYIRGVKGHVVMKQWVSGDGALPVIAETETRIGEGDNQHEGNLNIPAGYEKVILEITGVLDWSSFEVSLSVFGKVLGE